MRGRLFTFGCSFTGFKSWPTWADILGKEFESHMNFGTQGAGNLHIFIQFLAQSRYQQISKDDTVIVMWTNVTREDRFINGSWKPLGNIFSQGFYDENFIKKYVDIMGCFERDIPLMYATDMILQNIGCQYHMLSMVDIDNHAQYTKNKININHLVTLYEPTLNKFKPSVHNVIFNYDYESRPIPGFKKRPDYHPLPLEHLEYIQKVLPEYELSESTLKFAEEEQVKAYKKLEEQYKK